METLDYRMFNLNNFKTMPENTGIVGENKVNNAKPFSPRTSSHFDDTQLTAGTHRFGHIQPHWAFEAVAKDRITVRSSHDVRSYTLKAPLMQDLRINKDYFKIYYDAILPLNWDKVFTNPIQGDDVDSSEVNTVISRFDNILFNMVSTANSYSGRECIGHNTYNDCPLAVYFQFFVFLEYFFSAGSLFSLMDCHIWHTFKCAAPSNPPSGSSVINPTKSSFDSFFDSFLSVLATKVSNFQVIFLDPDGSFGKEYIVDLTGTAPLDLAQAVPFVPLNVFLDDIRDHPHFFFSSITPRNGITSFIPAYSFIYTSSGPTPLNYSRFAAYQLACAHYFTNDHVDYIYSANLYRENFWSAIFNAFAYNSVQNPFQAPGSTSPSDTVVPFFIYNGSFFPYDYLSGYIVENFLLTVSRWLANLIYPSADFDSPSVFGKLLLVVRELFGFRRSLRFRDYFTGSKPQPLAVGDVMINVDGNNQVSAIDVTRNIQRQRFFNAVMRSGRKMSTYLKDIFGSGSMPDYHDPQFLAHVSDNLFASEVENTGAAQVQQNARNTVTSTIRGNSNKYAFEIEVDRPCILLGLTSYDITRYYVRNIERQYFHVDRFDMFNPFMQTIGDQVVYGNELDALRPHNSAFAYQLRHMEYKQGINYAYGGVCLDSTDLDSWFFLADYKIPVAYTDHIGPDYIRSRPYELDRFYSSLTGHSLGTYFHFIIHNRNEVSANRPMIYAPGIL